MHGIDGEVEATGQNHHCPTATVLADDDPGVELALLVLHSGPEGICEWNAESGFEIVRSDSLNWPILAL